MLTAIVQARMGSRRLPGKVLAPIAGKPQLQRVIERVRRADIAVVVATTETAIDDPVADLCAALDVPTVRGSEHDVLDRYRLAALRFGADPVVRITADCPLIDPAVLRGVIHAYERGGYDYVANINPPTYPDGLDVEVFSFAALEQAWAMAELPAEREHVTLFVRNHPERFRIGNVTNEHDLSSLRWVVDEPHDLAFVRAVYAHFGETAFGMADLLNVIEHYPELGRSGQQHEQLQSPEQHGASQ